MAVSTPHPTYTPARVAEWDLCRDAYEGESAIKGAGTRYLPMPSGFTAQADKGVGMFAAYQERAQFPDIFAPSVGAMVGIIHGTDIQIDLPGSLEYLREDVDGGGMTLTDLHRRVTRALLVSGRQGILADAPQDGGEPRLAQYAGRTIINWDDEFYVLDESRMERDGFEWEPVTRYRVLELVEGRYVQTLWQDGERIEQFEPRGQGGRPIAAVPFSVVSAQEVGPKINTPPLIGVARAAKAIYQLSADYRHQLFFSGQETLVAINGEPPEVVGAGVVHSMLGGEGQPDLKYVSPSCSGIDAHLRAIEHNRDAAIQSGARLFEGDNRTQESGEARKMRFRSETANLQSIAQSSCALIEFALRAVAEMKGADPDDVTVDAPRDLLNATVTPQDAKALWEVVQARGLSYETYWTALQKGGLADPDRTADEEYRLIDEVDYPGGDAAI